ncbi:microviridin/marinostatin family tricyclic proteinase inhibitor [Chitinophaga pendula]|uniref:microviridin/marinostatin family tricyclic proteinase inhibitor n=1 Tax=Chitinophaga TaxID=79328 RepID=UPI000BAF5951|nr:MULTISPECIES: microviridin/marinostatin family tricyclic proteinase inhibitor [Chitinophaga]ASZ12354.1 hypothetical protein CK934_15990 [Chitinophaga sp. MD30]UCJ10052.1 microviridin/marinostatin family tricyclic proteinase inhibitor [Chitinophaga pendula]
MKTNASLVQPFFALFLEAATPAHSSVANNEKLLGAIPTHPLKDGAVTQKYPSDGDDGVEI